MYNQGASLQPAWTWRKGDPVKAILKIGNGKTRKEKRTTPFEKLSLVVKGRPAQRADSPNSRGGKDNSGGLGLWAFGWGRFNATLSGLVTILQEPSGGFHVGFPAKPTRKTPREHSLQIGPNGDELNTLKKGKCSLQTVAGHLPFSAFMLPRDPLFQTSLAAWTTSGSFKSLWLDFSGRQVGVARFLVTSGLHNVRCDRQM